MGRFDLHVHTIFCDGKASPEELVQSALRLGLDTLGFSGHGYTDFDGDFCMSPDGTREYRREIARLQAKYRGQLRILCGVEQDLYGCEPVDGYDYVIASVHYVRKDGQYLAVDESPEKLQMIINEHYDGDALSLAEDYYAAVGQLQGDIVGHFDLIEKFADTGVRFEREHPRYRAAWRAAADRLLERRMVFEINSGAMSRGWRKTAYPQEEILQYILQNGGQVILSSDCHSAEGLCFAFEGLEKWAKELGAVDLSCPV